MYHWPRKLMKWPSEMAPASLQFYHAIWEVVQQLLFRTSCYHVTGFSSSFSGLKQFLFLHVYFCNIHISLLWLSQWVTDRDTFHCSVRSQEPSKQKHHNNSHLEKNTKLNCSFSTGINHHSWQSRNLGDFCCHALAHHWRLHYSMEWLTVNCWSQMSCP